MKTLIVILALIFPIAAFPCVAGPGNSGGHHGGHHGGVAGDPGTSNGLSGDGENPDVSYPAPRDCDLIIYNGKCIKHIRPGLLTVDGKPFYYKP